MGKGSRNRQYRLNEEAIAPKKKQQAKQKKPMPKWAKSAIALALAFAVLLGVVAFIINDTGIIKRNRVLLESVSGKYDVTQQMATFIAWQEIYSSAYTYWYYCNWGIYSDDNAKAVIENFEDNPGGYALTVAKYAIEDSLRDSIDDIMENLKIYIAVCDEAVSKAENMTEADWAEVTEATAESLTSLKSQASNYISFSAFLKDAMGNGMKEKDIKSALNLINLYNCYASKMQEDFEAATTLADIEKYRDENPDEFFKTDYLSYAADSEEFAKQLAACTTADEFKALVVSNYLDANYKTIYNKYTTQVTAKNELESLKDSNGKYLTDTANGKALTEALDNLGVNAVETFKKNGSYTDKTELKTWLFNSKRVNQDIDVVNTTNGVYLVVFLSEEAASSADDASVQARTKFYAFTDGATYGEDENFKENIIKHISESIKGGTDLPTVEYIKAITRASELKTKLTADGANVTEILKGYETTVKTGVAEDDDSTSTLPQAVIDIATGSDAKVGSVLTASAGTTAYTIYVTAVDSEKETVDITFVTFESDPYYEIIDDLETSLEEVYPETETADFVSDAEEGTFDAWISELANKESLTSARKEHDANWFKTTEKDSDGNETTTYNAYMIINTPMYLEEELVVNGGYLEFSKDDHGAEASAEALEALAKLNGLTGNDLLDALYELDSSATISTAITESTVGGIDKELKKWFFEDERAANDKAKVAFSTEGDYAIAIFIEKTETWKSEAKTAYVSEKLTEWAEGLAANYTANEKALNQIGKPSPETETTTTTTAAVTTAAKQ